MAPSYSGHPAGAAGGSGVDFQRPLHCRVSGFVQSYAAPNCQSSARWYLASPDLAAEPKISLVDRWRGAPIFFKTRPPSGHLGVRVVLKMSISRQTTTPGGQYYSSYSLIILIVGALPQP